MRVWQQVTLMVVVATAAWAQAPDVSGMYEVSTEGSVKQLKAGGKGNVVLSIRSKDGAHVSDEAPLKIELKAEKAKLAKDKLTLADSVVKKGEGVKYADPRFEVPVTVEQAGNANVEAKLTFFICTDTVCSRQQKVVKIPIEVSGS